VPDIPDVPWRQTNRASWDERVGVHVESDFYDVEGFLAGRDTLRTFEPDELGPVEGCSLVHLQCHFGLDTLSWARRGATVTGLDFSPPAIDEATRLADALGIDASFVCADVYDAPQVLGRRFDVVYTGRGALNWLPDLDRWAGVVAALLNPGGRFYLLEFHPLGWITADESLDIVYDYFNNGTPFIDDSAEDYADPNRPLVNAMTYEWPHGLGEVLSALAGTGLRIEFLHEFDEISHLRWPFLEEQPGRRRVYRLPAGMPSLPLEYSILTRAPEVPH
jgi:SAM-dependent methyltransferase